MDENVYKIIHYIVMPYIKIFKTKRNTLYILFLIYVLRFITSRFLGCIITSTFLTCDNLCPKVFSVIGHIVLKCVGTLHILTWIKFYLRLIDVPNLWWSGSNCYTDRICQRDGGSVGVCGHSNPKPCRSTHNWNRKLRNCWSRGEDFSKCISRFLCLTKSQYIIKINKRFINAISLFFAKWSYLKTKEVKEIMWYTMKDRINIFLSNDRFSFV